MSDTGFNAGDVELQYAVITGDGGDVDIRRRIHDFSIYENIKTPYTVINLTIYDNANVLQNIGLDGRNAFTVSFGQPGQDPYVGTYILTTIDRAENTDNFRTAVYSAQGYSPHMMNLPRIQKAYRDLPFSDVVADLVGNLTDAKPLRINAPARNMAGNQNMPWNVNGQQIFQAIRNAMLSSASAVDQSSAYVLFENRFNLVLDTLENLLRNAGNGPSYYQRHLGTNFLQDVALQQFTIMTYTESSRIDSTSTIQSPTQTRIFDLFGQAFNALGAGGSSSFSSIPYNILRPPTFAQEFLAARRQMAAKFDQQAITIHVPLNPAVTVGGGFNAYVMNPLGDLTSADVDPISGAFLASEVRHTVDFSRRYCQGISSYKGVKGPNLDL